MKFTPEISEERKNLLADSSLILPSVVSIGNVGQLAMDLLLASLKPEKISAFHYDALLPVVGSNPLDLDSKDLMTAGEVYFLRDKKMVFLQIRSALASGRRDEFLNSLLNWVREMEFFEVITLSSTCSDEKIDSQMSHEALRFLATSTKDLPYFKELGWKELEKRERFPSLKREEKVHDDSGIFLPGGGFAKELFFKCKNEEIEMKVLMTFSSEGDNTQDAFRLVQYLNQWKSQLGFEDNRMVKIPPSWSHFFGNPTLSTIY